MAMLYMNIILPPLAERSISELQQIAEDIPVRLEDIKLYISELE